MNERVNLVITRSVSAVQMTHLYINKLSEQQTDSDRVVPVSGIT